MKYILIAIVLTPSGGTYGHQPTPLTVEFATQEACENTRRQLEADVNSSPSKLWVAFSGCYEQG